MSALIAIPMVSLVVCTAAFIVIDAIGLEFPFDGTLMDSVGEVCGHWMARINETPVVKICKTGFEKLDYMKIGDKLFQGLLLGLELYKDIFMSVNAATIKHLGPVSAKIFNCIHFTVAISVFIRIFYATPWICRCLFWIMLLPLRLLIRLV